MDRRNRAPPSEDEEMMSSLSSLSSLSLNDDRIATTINNTNDDDVHMESDDGGDSQEHQTPRVSPVFVAPRRRISPPPGFSSSFPGQSTIVFKTPTSTSRNFWSAAAGSVSSSSAASSQTSTPRRGRHYKTRGFRSQKSIDSEERRVKSLSQSQRTPTSSQREQIAVPETPSSTASSTRSLRSGHIYSTQSSEDIADLQKTREAVYKSQRRNRDRDNSSPAAEREPAVSGAERVRQHRHRQATAAANEKAAAQIMAMIEGHLRGPCNVVNQYLQSLSLRAQGKIKELFRTQIADWMMAPDEVEKKKIFEEIENNLKKLLKKSLMAIEGHEKEKVLRIIELFDQMTEDPDMKDRTLYEMVDEAMQSWDQVTLLLQISTAEYGRLAKNVMKQLEKELKGDEWHTADENCLRRLGRIPYHIVPAGGNLRHAKRMAELFPKLYADFIGNPSAVATAHMTQTNETQEESSDDDDEEERQPSVRLDPLVPQPVVEMVDSDVDRSQLSALSDSSDSQEDEHDPEEEGAGPELNVRDEARVNREIAEALGADVMMAVGDALNFRALRNATYIYGCRPGVVCPTCDPREAAYCLVLLMRFLKKTTKDIGRSTMKKIDELYGKSEPGLGDMSVAEWLKQYEACYQGMRSIVRRLADMRTMAKCITLIRRFFHSCNYETLKAILKLENMPARIRLEFEHTYTGHIADEHHAEQYVMKRWELEANENWEAGNQIEIFPCQICNQLRNEKNIRLYPAQQPGDAPPDWMLPFMTTDPTVTIRPHFTTRAAMIEYARRLRSRSPTPTKEIAPPRPQRRRTIAVKRDDENNDREESQMSIITSQLKAMDKCYGVCLTCDKTMKKGYLPADAYRNDLDSVLTPDCLLNLNWIEKLLIQLVRPIHTTVVLKNIGGKKSGVRGTSGAMVIVPMDINSTVKHVAQTLPSTSMMTIQVQTNFGDKRIVNLPRILEALRWLKANNHLYADIIIDDQFRFEDNGSIFFEKDGATDDDREALIHRDLRDLDDDHILTQDACQLRISRDADAVNMENMTPAERYRLLGHRYKPIKVDEPYLDAKAMPELHPTGDFGYSGHHDHSRSVKLDVPRYIRNRMLDRTRRYAASSDWLIFFYHYQLQREITSVLGVQARVEASTTGVQIGAKINKNDPEFVKQNMTSIFGKVRGFPSFWKKVKAQLKSHFVAFGAPTWFLTLNPSTKDWRTVREIYKVIHPGATVPKDEAGLSRFIARDPSLYSRYFYRRVRSFMSKVLKAGKDEEGPLGTVTHWFHRFEYQQKGLPHVHAVLWTKERPAVDASEEEIRAYLDRHITCRLPDSTEEERLYRRVQKHQMHWDRHNSTCLRIRRYGPGRRRIAQYCRFHFPRPVLSRTIVTALNPLVRRLPGVKRQAYYLRRRKTEVMVNDYNPLCLLLWNGNMDIQYITHNEEAVFAYVAGYATKSAADPKGVMGDQPPPKKRTRHDLPTSAGRGRNDDLEGDNDDDEDVIPKTHDPTGKLTAIFRQLLKMANQRQVGTFEISDQLLGHKLFEFDCEHVWIYTNKSEERSRMMLAKSITDRNPGGRGYAANWYDDYYPGRHSSLEDCSLFNLMTQFHVTDVSTVKGLPTQTTTTQVEEAAGDGMNISSDDAFDDYAEEQLQIRRERTRQQLPAGAYQRNVFSDLYHTKDKASPFYSHEGEIPIGDWVPLNVRGQQNKKVMRKKKPLCPQLYFPYLNWEDSKVVEDFHRRCCMLFIPWREESALLGSAESYVERWEEWMEELKRQSPDAAKDIGDFLARSNALRKDDYESMKRYEQQRKDLEAAEIDEAGEDGMTNLPAQRGLVQQHETPEQKAESYGRLVDEAQHELNLQSCQTSQLQWQLFTEITAKVDEQERQKEADKQTKTIRDEDELMEKQIRIFISGTAGVGKSFLIDLLANALSLKYVPEKQSRERGLDPAVLLAAPTALAGCNIKGVTIHSLLAIRVIKECLKHGMAIPDDVLDRKRSLFRNVKLLIIDEISMCSGFLLWQIDYNLKKIMGNNLPWGGINIAVFGDLLQLGPVNATPVWVPPKKELIEAIIGGRVQSVPNIWRTLSYAELTVNQRQKGDTRFADLMGRARYGHLNEDDHLLLASRIIKTTDPAGLPTKAECIAEYKGIKDRVMAIFPTNAEVDDFNQIIMEGQQTEKKEEEIQKLICYDTNVSSTNQFVRPRATEITPGIRERPYQSKLYNIDVTDVDRKMKRRQTRVPTDSSGGALPAYQDGLHDVLVVSKGSRVMVTKNIDSSCGLVNSAVGTVVGFVMKEPERLKIVKSVLVKLDGNGRTFAIDRCSSIYNLDRSSLQKLYEKRNRYQFPLTVCYAATVHKVQGMTLPHVLVSTAGMFSEGHMFVALSRAKTLEGVHLMDYYPDHLYVDREAVLEYNRLRGTIKMAPIDPVPEKAPRYRQRMDSRFGAAVEQPAIVHDPGPLLPRLRHRGDKRPNYVPDKIPGESSSSDLSSGDSSSSSSLQGLGKKKKKRPADSDNEYDSDMPLEERAIGDAEFRALTQGDFVAKARQTRVVETLPPLPFDNSAYMTADRRLIKNNGHMISAVNILQQMVQMTTDLKAWSRDLSPAAIQLSRLFVGLETRTVQYLAEKLSTKCRDDQGFVVPDVSELLNHYPETVRNRCGFTETRRYYCETCNRRHPLTNPKEDTMARHIFAVNMAPIISSSIDLDFAVLRQLVPYPMEKQRCETCGGRVMLKRTVNFLPETQYLLMAPFPTRPRDRPGVPAGYKTKITGYKKDGNELFPETVWHLVALSEYKKSPTGVADIYRTWIVGGPEGQDGYTVVQDDTVEHKQQMDPLLLNRSELMLFVRKEKMREYRGKQKKTTKKKIKTLPGQQTQFLPRLDLPARSRSSSSSSSSSDSYMDISNNENEQQKQQPKKGGPRRLPPLIADTTTKFVSDDLVVPPAPPRPTAPPLTPDLQQQRKRTSGINKIQYLCKNALTVSADCIVNAANKNLQHGGGFDHILRSSAGPQIDRETGQLRQQLFGGADLPADQAVMTGAYNLSPTFKKVIHAAAPQLAHEGQQPTLQQMYDLMAAYRAVFELMAKAGLKSVVCPLLGTGLFYWNKTLGTGLALMSAMIFYRRRPDTSVQNIVFAEYGKRIYHDISTRCLGGQTLWELNIGGGAVDSTQYWADQIRELLKNLHQAGEAAIVKQLQDAGREIDGPPQLRQLNRQTIAQPIQHVVVTPSSPVVAVPPPQENHGRIRQRPPGIPREIPILWNEGASCFALSLTQVLLRAWMGLLRTEEVQRRNNVLAPLLLEMSREQVTDCRRLLRICDGHQAADRHGQWENFDDSTQHHDPVEYLSYLLRYYAEGPLRQSLTFESGFNYRCESCQKITPDPDTQAGEILYIQLHRQHQFASFAQMIDLYFQDEEQGTFQFPDISPELLEIHGLPVQHNSDCRRELHNWNHKRRPMMKLRDTTQHIMVQLQLFENNGQLMEDRQIPIPQWREQFGGKQFTPVAAIQHQGSSIHHAHYVAYVRRQGKWYEIDDHRIRPSPHPQGLPPMMRGIVLIMFFRDLSAPR